MNIKQAKQEIIDTVQAYLLKNEYDEYVIPRVHQRPVLLLGAPGIGKTTDHGTGSQRVWCGTGRLYDHTSHQTECDRSSIYL